MIFAVLGGCSNLIWWEKSCPYATSLRSFTLNLFDFFLTSDWRNTIFCCAFSRAIALVVLIDWFEQWPVVWAIVRWTTFHRSSMCGRSRVATSGPQVVRPVRWQTSHLIRMWPWVLRPPRHFYPPRHDELSGTRSDLNGKFIYWRGTHQTVQDLWLWNQGEWLPSRIFTTRHRRSYF